MIKVLVLVCAIVAITICQRSEAVFQGRSIEGHPCYSAAALSESIPISHDNTDDQESASIQNVLNPVVIGRFVCGNFQSSSNMKLHVWSHIGLPGFRFEYIYEPDFLRIFGSYQYVESALQTIRRSLPRIESSDPDSRNAPGFEIMHLSFADVDIGSQLPFAGLSESLISLTGFLESKGDIADTNRSNDKHEQGPFCHILLGLQVIVFSGFFVFGLFRLRTAYRRTGWARFYAFEEAQICMIGGGVAALVVMYIAVKAPC